MNIIALRFKNEKDIFVIIRNLPMSIIEFKIIEELKNLKCLVKSIIRLTNNDKAPTSLMAVQLINYPILNDISKLNKILNCIIITEPRRKSKDPQQCINCPRYGYIHKSCKLYLPCVKCNDTNYFSKYNKVIESPQPV